MNMNRDPAKEAKIMAGTNGFVNLTWTHRSTLIWPHPGQVAAGL